jgi:hypothetical protein
MPWPSLSKQGRKKNTREKKNGKEIKNGRSKEEKKTEQTINKGR